MTFVLGSRALALLLLVQLGRKIGQRGYESRRNWGQIYETDRAAIVNTTWAGDRAARENTLGSKGAQNVAACAQVNSDTL